jgi:hypothetical protein
MNKIKTCMVVLFAFISVTTVKAQTADEIIAKHIGAIGGKDKLAQINSVYIESTTEVMGNESATKTYIVNGKGYKNESDFGGQSLVQVFTEKGGWAINPFGGSSDPTAITDDEYKSGADAIYAGSPIINYAAHGGKVDLQGQEKINDVNAYKIKYTNKYGTGITYYVDPSTWYIIESVKQANMMGQSVTVTTTYSNYQKTDFGVFIPYTINVDMGQFQMKMTTNKVEVNKDIDLKIFDMPRK